MEKGSKDPSDEREGGEIIKDAACCEDGCCSWYDNTPAQSEGGIDGGKGCYPSVPGGDD